jgi:hypothetical protein
MHTVVVKIGEQFMYARRLQTDGVSGGAGAGFPRERIKKEVICHISTTRASKAATDLIGLDRSIDRPIFYLPIAMQSFQSSSKFKHKVVLGQAFNLHWFHTPAPFRV